MIEQVKEFLTDKYNLELEKYNNLKQEMDELENEFKSDDSESVYQESLKNLNKKYGLFKRGKDYKEELNTLRLNYNEQLKQFQEKYNHYVDLKNEASKINVYIIQKKLEQLMNANTLEDLKLTEERATRILSGEEQF